MSSRQVLFAAAGIASLFVSASASAQNKPFPTGAHYAQGFVPPAVTTAVVQSSYDAWKATYVLGDCGNGYSRVDDGNGDASTFSEGQGYGMVLTAYFGDKTTFDGLWAFAQKNFNPSTGLMGWHVTCSGYTTSDGGAGSATDGDTDIGFSLIVAAAQWGGTYAQQAQTYLSTLQTVDFTACSPSGRNMPTDGNWQMSGACTAGSSSSYFMPGYYRAFQAFTGNAFWGKTADDVVTLWGLAADPTTGIIVDTVDQNGVPGSGTTYDYNSSRTPWRAVLDYLWYGTPAVQQQLTKVTNWANTVGISKIVDGYDANGTASGQYTGLNEFVGGFTAGAMANSASLVDSFSSYFVTIANTNGAYYGSSLRTLYLLALSGNQWNPMDAASDGGTVPSGTSDSGTVAPVEGSEGGGTTTPGSEGGGADKDNGTSHSGCGCRLEPSASPPAAGAGAASLLALLTLRRRRR
jgi:MYXO-CTERM domain-containing protein